MSQRPDDKQITLEIPEEIQAQARDLIRDSFALLADNGARLRENLQRFKANQEAVKARIERGARRTNGRIV